MGVIEMFERDCSKDRKSKKEMTTIIHETDVWP